jgi:hypothetical protein
LIGTCKQQLLWELVFQFAQSGRGPFKFRTGRPEPPDAGHEVELDPHDVEAFHRVHPRMSAVVPAAPRGFSHTSYSANESSWRNLAKCMV